MNQSLLFRTVIGLFLFVHLLGAPILVSAEEPASNALQTEVITLNYVLPQDILPTLTPFLEKGGQIKPINNQLIIQSTPSNITALKSIIEQIDIAPKKLMITISNGHDKPSEIESISPNGDVTFGQETSGYHTLNISTSRETETQVSSMRVDNGQVAFIKTGVTIPLVTSQLGGTSNFQSQHSLDAIGNRGLLHGQGTASGNSEFGGQDVDYQNLSNGFYAKPQLIGKEVKMELSTQNDQPISSNAGSTIQPAYTTFKAQTTVMIPVGKWTYFGGNEAQDQVSNGTSYRTGSRDQGQKSLWLRVDVIPQNE